MSLERSLDRAVLSGLFRPGSTSLILIGVFTVLGIYFWRRKRRFYNLAAKIPGPPTVPLLGNALDFLAVNNTTLIDKFLNLMDVYGGTARVWLGPRLLVHISNPKDIEICLNSSKLIEKNEMYSFFDDMLGQGLLNASGDIWKKHRRIIAPTFHNSVLRHFVEIFDRQSQTLVNRLEKNMHQNINIFPFVRDCALDFITETALETTIDAQGETVSESTLAAERYLYLTILNKIHKHLFWFRIAMAMTEINQSLADCQGYHGLGYSLDLGTQKFNLNSEYWKTFITGLMMHITFDRIFKVWLHPDQLFFLTKNGREYLRLRRIVKGTTTPLLHAKKQEISAEEAGRHQHSDLERDSSKRKSFFRLLVNLNENGENFNDQELRDEVMTIIITGYETTAATVAFVLVMLGIHQDVQNRVYEEVCSMKERLQGRQLEAEDLQYFEYMDRVIKETLRLFPVGPVVFRKATADVTLATCTVPMGASVVVVFLHTHRDPAIWKNPLQFNPDHFLPEETAKRHPYSFNPFSAGPRGCIGQKYAQMSMKVMLYHILSKFRIHCDKKMEDIGIKIEVTLKMTDGFNVRLEPRQ